MIRLRYELDSSVPYVGPERDVPTARPNVIRRMRTEKTELEGTFWVFTHPNLIPWDHEVVPLFCPPTGGHRKTGSEFKGDLWAIDSQGQLLIIENKTIKRIKEGDDPFKQLPVDQRMIHFEHLKANWLQCLKDEDYFRQLNPTGLPKQFPALSWPGQFDSSLGRYTCRRYPDVYRRTAAKIGSKEHKEIVTRSLEAYKANRPAPHYFALFTLFGEDEPLLRDDSEYSRLVQPHDVGQEHVHMVAVKRSPECYEDECQVFSYRVYMPEN